MTSPKSLHEDAKQSTANGTKIAVVIIARNEEKFIGKTLENLLTQELLPYRIIVVNDGSTDKTDEITHSFNHVEVVNRKNTGQNLQARKELANTINAGLQKLDDDKNCEFVMVTGADLLLQKNYFSTIISRMKPNPKIAIASGIVEGEYSIEPRGSRVVRYDFWKKLGLKYPVNYGYEGYLVLKAQSLGYEVVSYSDIITTSQRKTGSSYDAKLYFYYGRALKALGYTVPYTFAKALIFAKKNPRGAFHMLRGFFAEYNQLYEPELREYVRKMQNHKIIHFEYVKRTFNMIKH